MADCFFPEGARFFIKVDKIIKFNVYTWTLQVFSRNLKRDFISQHLSTKINQNRNDQDKIKKIGLHWQGRRVASRQNKAHSLEILIIKVFRSSQQWIM